MNISDYVIIIIPTKSDTRFHHSEFNSIWNFSQSDCSIKKYSAEWDRIFIFCCLRLLLCGNSPFFQLSGLLGKYLNNFSYSKSGKLRFVFKTYWSFQVDFKHAKVRFWLFSVTRILFFQQVNCFFSRKINELTYLKQIISSIMYIFINIKKEKN